MILIFRYDKNHKLRQNQIFLANPQKDYIGVLTSAKNIKVTLFMNDLNTASFRIYKFENNIENKNYTELEIKRLVEIRYIGWFQISNVKEHDDGMYSYKDITCIALENELTGKRIDDIKGVFALYDITDTEHSLLHIITRQTDWKIGHVDNELVEKWRTFSIDSNKIYNFLVQDVSKSFSCLFLFDVYEKTINAYKLSNYGELTDIIISKKNILQEYIRESSLDNIITKLRVTGADGLDIRAVNPTGSNYIINVNYFKNTGWMSQGLVDALDNYENALNSIAKTYTTTLSLYKQRQSELTVLNADLETLNANKKAKENVQGSYVQLYNGTPPSTSNEYQLYIEAVNELADTNRQIAIKKKEILNKENQIDDIRQQLDDIGTSLDQSKYFTKAHLTELEVFLTENDEYQDSTFIATDTMTAEEIIDMKLELLENAKEELKRASQPQYTVEILASNLYSIIDDDTRKLSYDKWKEQLQLGNIITIKFEKGYITTARLIKIEIDFDNLADLKLTFSDKSRFDNELTELGELIADAGRTSNSMSLSKFGWDKASKLTSPVQEFITSTLNATVNAIQSNDNQDMYFDTYGLHMRKWLPDQNKYDDKQAWWTNNILLFSDDGFKSAKTGIGQFTTEAGETFYGFIGEAIISNIVASESLTIKNANNTFIVDKNGALLIDANFTITRGNNKIVLDPIEGFSIYNKSDKVIFLDSNGDANFKGHITASSITLTNAIGLTINNGNGTFTVSADGHIHAESGDIAGFIMDNNVLWAGKDTKYIRISSDHTYINDQYGAIDLGLSPEINPSTGMKDTIIHLRSDGYARFGLNALDGSVKFNYKDQDFTGKNKTFTFYTKNFRIANDGLVTSTGINLKNGSPIRGYSTNGIPHNLVNFSPNDNVVVGQENDPQNTHIYGLDELAFYIGSDNNKAFIMSPDKFSFKLPIELNGNLDVAGDLGVKGNETVSGNLSVSGKTTTNTLSSSGNITMGGNLVATQTWVKAQDYATKAELDSAKTTYYNQGKAYGESLHAGDYSRGYNSGERDGYSRGYSEGYAKGLSEGQSQGGTD